MITFEDMNLPVPSAYRDPILTYGVIHLAITDILKNGFAKSEYQNFLEAFRIS
jgi:hypothetical protein